MVLEKLNQVLKQLILKSIYFYQRWISLDQGILKNFGVKVCRFHPTCSEYMCQSIEKFGILRGGLKGVRRILRCNPFSEGGYDPVD